MNQDSEALQRTLLELIQVLLPGVSLADLEAARQALEPPIDSPEAHTPAAIDLPPLSAPLGQNDSGPFSAQNLSFVDFGEVPAVQDRYHALLKRRLESEIQRKPPLFPWETEVLDYEVNAAGVLNTTSGAATALPQKLPVWLVPQLKALNLPIAMPDAVLAQLFQQCQATVQASLLEGAKLVRSVEALFPNQASMLNQLAGLVVVSPARSTATLPTQDPNLPLSYEAAVPAQQMLLSLMAAREMLGALTLEVSSRQPRLDREWLTELGTLTLQVRCDLPTLRIQAELPTGGSLKLTHPEQESIADRSDAGIVAVELPTVQSPQSYTLEVSLPEAEPLVFVVRVEA
jgi:hypothetical protein